MQDDRAIAVIAFAILIAATILAASSSQYCDYRISQVVEQYNIHLNECYNQHYIRSGEYGLFNDSNSNR